MAAAVAEHNEAVRTEIERFGGREVKTTGTASSFSSTAQPVRYAGWRP